jgi:hypothetical protein
MARPASRATAAVAPRTMLSLTGAETIDAVGLITLQSTQGPEAKMRRS